MLCINECMKVGSALDAGISNYPSDFEVGKKVRNPPTFEFEFELRHIPTNVYRTRLYSYTEKLLLKETHLCMLYF